MTPSKKTDEATRKAWRDLGFYYDVDHDLKEWRLVGSRNGLRRFADLLRAYAADSNRKRLSEHEHYGPYMYLKFMTADQRGIDAHSISGCQSDLAELSEVVVRVIARSPTGSSVSLRDPFAPNAEYDLILEIREDGFDPATVDPQLTV